MEKKQEEEEIIDKRNNVTKKCVLKSVSLWKKEFNIISDSTVNINNDQLI